jgi:ATP-dependent helicase/nuclease subunit A
VEAGDLLHAVDRVRQVLEDGGNLADAADALEADSEASNEVESLPLEPGRSDVVRLMNLHKAKGLEADVVFLADPCGGMGKWIDVHIERDGPNALGWFKVEKKSESSFATVLLGEHADWEQHKSAEQPYLDAEEDRLLYVAATRAREALVVSRYTGRVRSAAWGVLNNALVTASELPVAALVKGVSLKPAVSSASAQHGALAARVARESHVNTASWSITSVTAEAKHIAAIATVGEPADGDDATRAVTPNTPSHRADAGMAWGTLIHGLLEHAMRHKDASREDLRRLATWLTVEEPQLRAVLDQAIHTVLDVSNAPFWDIAAKSQHGAETPFTYLAAADAALSGVVDLMFKSNDGWQIIDYKTDVTQRLAEAYQLQLEMYERALASVGIDDATSTVHAVRYPTGEGTPSV